MEPKTRFELVTSSLPRKRSTPELLGLELQKIKKRLLIKLVERETRLELATFSLEG